VLADIDGKELCPTIGFCPTIRRVGPRKSKGVITAIRIAGQSRADRKSRRRCAGRAVASEALFQNVATPKVCPSK
jgi:hypothetical protein